jgi:hypothetical protein
MLRNGKAWSGVVLRRSVPEDADKSSVQLAGYCAAPMVSTTFRPLNPVQFALARRDTLQ